jgi:hypothetical protein
MQPLTKVIYIILILRVFKVIVIKKIALILLIHPIAEVIPYENLSNTQQQETI